MTTSDIPAATTELADLVRELALVRGEVTLSSGRTSDHYFDLRRVSLHPLGARLVGRAVLDAAEGLSYDVVGGLVLGAVPIAIAAMNSAHDRGRHLPAVAIRKEPKRHGLGRQVEGQDIAGRSVLLVEDTSTTGASTLEAADAVRSEGAHVVGVVLLVDRGGAAAIAAAGIPVRSVLLADQLLENTA